MYVRTKTNCKKKKKMCEQVKEGINFFYHENPLQKCAKIKFSNIIVIFLFLLYSETCVICSFCHSTTYSKKAFQVCY